MLRQIRFFLQNIERGRAMEFLHSLVEFHRIRGSSGYDAALDFLKGQLNLAGIENEVFEFPLDGETYYWTWKMPPAWEAKGGRVTLLTKNPIVICDYSKNPICLVPGSSSIHGRFPLVSVATGTKESDYKQDVRGKVVLATGHPSLVYPLAVEKYGARCILFDFMPAENKSIGRTKFLLPDLYSYAGMFPNIGEAGAAFTITHRAARDIRRRLSRGPLEVEVIADAENFKGKGRVLIARIPGRDPDGPVVVAHLCHPSPGANDNASGAALAAEMAITFYRLIAKGDLPQPSKTLTFLWVPEMFGTVALAHEKPDMVRMFLTGIDLDMVGENQEITKGPLIVEMTPWSIPCFMGCLVAALLDELARSKAVKLPDSWAFEVRDFNGGSDHYILSDPTIGVPTTMIGHWPDLYYHSSGDTPDKVSPDEMAIVGAVTSTALWLVSWEHDMVNRVIKYLIDCAEKRLSAEAGGSSPERLSLLWAQRREGALSYAVTREEPYRVVAEVDRGFAELAKRFGIDDLFFTVGGPVYRRNFKAPLYMRTFFASNPDAHRRFVERITRDQEYARGVVEAVFLTNGRRSFQEIMEFLAAEYPLVNLDDIRELFLALREADMIEQVS
jgi:hypothetical protein